MSTQFIGRFLGSESDGGPTKGLVRLRVTLIDGTTLIGSGGLGNHVLGTTIVDNVDGLVQFSGYRCGTTQGRRKLEIVITDITGRRVAFKTDDGRMIIDDTSDTTLDVGDIVVREADAYGLLVTLGTGETSIQSPNGFGWGFKPGNRVTTLMGEDAFRYAAKLFREAKEALAISQLFFPFLASGVASPLDYETRLVDAQAARDDPPPPYRLNDALLALHAQHGAAGRSVLRRIGQTTATPYRDAARCRLRGGRCHAWCGKPTRRPPPHSPSPRPPPAPPATPPCAPSRRSRRWHSRHAMAALTDTQLTAIADNIFVLRTRGAAKLAVPAMTGSTAFKDALKPIATTHDFVNAGIAVIDFTRARRPPTSGCTTRPRRCASAARARSR